MSDDNRGPSVAAQIRRAPAWVRSQFTWKRALLIGAWVVLLGKMTRYFHDSRRPLDRRRPRRNV